ncbi:MAG: hypothetical protein EB060_05285 [Proteobacteria bacterium]|nr:hypothetical protein [Pseudomonadota bacterium]
MELYHKAVFAFLGLPFSVKLGVFILVNAWAILWLSMRRATMRPGLPLFYLGLVALAIYVQFGSFYQALPARAVTAEQTTAKPRQSFVNFFALYDTYYAARYFVEVGYTGLHSTTAYADSTTGAPLISTSYVRNLQVPETVLPKADAIIEGREIYLPRFSEESWRQFTQEIGYLRQIGFPGWLNQAVHGTPSIQSPLWMHLGGVFSKYLPLSTPWVFDETMDSSEIIPFVDITLFFITSLFVWLGFGFAGMGLTFIYFGINAMANMATIGGGYMQLAAFATLAVGLSLVQIRHTFLGGLFVALAACLNGFFIVFLIPTAPGANYILSSGYPQV